MTEKSTRATVKMKKPNPLFESWILEWIEEAEQNNSSLAEQLRKALESLRKYPIVLDSGKECLVLEHFDTRLCIRLDRRLLEYKNGVNDIEGVHNSFTSSGLLNELHGRKLKEKKNGSLPEKKKDVYKPAYRSGSYALLATLLRNEGSPMYQGGVKKGDLIRDAQTLSNSSFIRPQPGSFYTAWSSMSILVQKKLVAKKGNKFSLTNDGRGLAAKLIEIKPSSPVNVPGSLGTQMPPEIVASLLAPAKPHGRKVTKYSPAKSNDSQETSESALGHIQVELVPGSFNVILLVDSKEVLGGCNKDESGLLSGLIHFGVPFEVKSLRVGDFAWVARKPGVPELTLPYLIERKRMDDLARSIKDIRFHEQKFRLKRCGLVNVIYLIEEHVKGALGLPLPNLTQAAVNTLVNDNFIVKVTANHKETIMYIATLTRILETLFQSKTLFSCPKGDIPKFCPESEVAFLPTFSDFCHDAVKTKNMSVKEMFMKQLVQAHGLSVEKASAVTSVYSSPASFIKDLLKNDNALSNLGIGTKGRNLGPAISSLLIALYTKKDFNSTLSS